MRLKNKVAIVTGSGKGIGEGIALCFAEEGAKVVVNDLSEPDARRTVDTIKNEGPTRRIEKCGLKTKWQS